MVPRLRPLEMDWVQYDGQRLLRLRDPLHLTDAVALLPEAVAFVLSFCDGTRDAGQVSAALARSSGLAIPPSHVDALVAQLDDALLLESPRFGEAYTQALAAYRSAPYRKPALAGSAYPADGPALRRALRGYARPAGPSSPPGDAATWRGVLSPHIDYRRGGPLYARVWGAAAATVRAADLAIIIGTDHHGSPGSITLTRQSYASPLGILPTDGPVVDAVEARAGSRIFDQELHHRFEHSVELAAVWLQFARGDRPLPVVPILTGSFHHFVAGQAEPSQDALICAVVEALRSATRGRRCLVISAGDLAHVGPAFGDAVALDVAAKRDLERHDREVLAALCAGDAEMFFTMLRDEGDARRVCGLPCTYLALRLLDGCTGAVLGYDQCPADAGAGSVVSVAGVALT